jgi:hypothetical protein
MLLLFLPFVLKFLLKKHKLLKISQVTLEIILNEKSSLQKLKLLWRIIPISNDQRETYL